MDQIKHRLQTAMPLVLDRADLMLGTLAACLIVWAIAWDWITVS
jgi:hypothetical protein